MLLYKSLHSMEISRSLLEQELNAHTDAETANLLLDELQTNQVLSLSQLAQLYLSVKSKPKKGALKNKCTLNNQCVGKKQERKTMSPFSPPTTTVATRLMSTNKNFVALKDRKAHGNRLKPLSNLRSIAIAKPAESWFLQVQQSLAVGPFGFPALCKLREMGVLKDDSLVCSEDKDWLTTEEATSETYFNDRCWSRSKQEVPMTSRKCCAKQTKCGYMHARQT